jgi:hypothetical protein
LVTRDKIGEAMWFIYTGVLVTSLVQLNIINRGCVSSPDTMQKKYQAFLKKEEKAEQKRELSTSQVYTLT